MKDKATLLAVAGAVVMGLGTLALAFKTGNLDSELVKLIVTSLMSFAGGYALKSAD